QTQQGEDNRENPEPDDHGVFLPASQFEMVMQWGHDKNPATGRFEADHLENDRERFDDENAAHHNQEQFLFTTNGNYSKHPADHERKKHEGKPSHVGDDRRFDKWHVERAGLHFEQWAGEENARDNRGKHNLKNQFESAADALRFSFSDLEIIVGEAERAEVNH